MATPIEGMHRKLTTCPYLQLLPDTPESAYEEFPNKTELNKNERIQPNPPAGRPGQAPGAASRGPEPYGRRSEDNRPFGRQPSQASRNGDGDSMYSGPRRRPSNDTDGSYARKPLDPVPPGPATATSGVVIPNKSTIAEEEIQVPYGRDDSDSRPRDSDIRDSVVTDNSGNAEVVTALKGGAPLSSSSSKWDKSPATTPLQGGLSALAAGFDKRNESALSDEDDLKTDFFDNSTVAGRPRSASGSSAAGRRLPDRGVGSVFPHLTVLTNRLGPRPRGNREITQGL